jgi:hypothetical protein
MATLATLPCSAFLRFRVTPSIAELTTFVALWIS